MNADLDRLAPYPFERLAALLDGVQPAAIDPIALSIGEPRHAPPPAVLEALCQSTPSISHYPATRGSERLRESIAGWLNRRFGLTADEQLTDTQILPLNGTREGLFAIAQCLLDRTASARDVLMPNPYYQIYEGAALLAGCRPSYYTISADADADMAAISDQQLQQAQLVFICTPGNPTGSVLSLEALQTLIERAIRHDVIIVSDECYTEIHREHSPPPASLLQAAAAMGNEGYSHCLSFHSLSKRSNLPGMRSGFVAGDASLVEAFFRYRTYHGCAMSPAIQSASIVAWDDDEHVRVNRRAYDDKFAQVVPVLNEVMSVSLPDAGFYLWPDIGTDEEAFTRQLLEQTNIRVLPGSYLGRDTGAGNPGRQRLRLALVDTPDNCLEAAERIRHLLQAS